MTYYVPFDQQEFNRWIIDNGDNTLRLDYELKKDSVVIDAGAYLGDFAYNINHKYNSIVFALEPVEDFYLSMENRFSQNAKVIPLNYALTDKTAQFDISLDGDASSFTFENLKSIKVLGKDFKEFIEENNIDIIDLIKINIEGAEFDLLDRIIELNLLNKIKNLQIQFHRHIPDCINRRNKIIDSLSKTHACSWNYEWIWESWKLK
jgi:FkbM family methyltransferase